MDAAAEPLLDALLRQHQVGVAVCDADGRLRAFNPEMEGMVGPLTICSTQPWADAHQLFDASGAHPLGDADVPLARALAGEVLVDAPITVRLPGQPIRQLLCTAAPLHDEAGAPSGAVVMVSEVVDSGSDDLDEEARRERHGARMQRVMDFAARLTTVVNHQVRTPLAVLKGHVELLQDEVADAPANVQRALPALQRAVDSLTGVVEDLSDAIDVAEASDPHLEAVDLVRIVQDAVEMARVARTDGRVTVSPDSEDYVPATADRVWVRRAVVSLIAVVDASTASRDVIVHVVGDGDVVVVTVAPAAAGPGVAAGRSLPANPRGLGVPLADAVALAHDGHVVIAEGPHGITATLRLARQPERAR
jgi:signal transduction histidine kinase